MRIKYSKKLSNLAKDLDIYDDLESLLKSDGIICISQRASEFHEGDDRKLFNFGHEYHDNAIVSFWTDDFMYYAVATEKQILAIFKRELKDINNEAF